MTSCIGFISSALAQSADEIFANVFGDQQEAVIESIVLPVLVDGRDAGNVRASVDVETGTAALDFTDLASALEPFVASPTMTELAGLVPESGMLPLGSLGDAGVQAEFDAFNLTVVVRVPPEIRPQGELSFARGQPPGIADALPTASRSGYINLYTGLDVIHSDGGAPDGDFGIQPLNIYLDGANSLLGGAAEAELFYDQSADRPWHRGDVRLVLDNMETATRTELGDLTYPTVGFQNYVPMAGFGWARDFDITPYAVTQPSGRYAFVLDAPSQVDIEVNGRIVDSLNLQPGPYSLSDLPVTPGTNDVVIHIKDEFGRDETLVYQQYYDGRLLAEGLSEFGLAGGFPSIRNDGLYRYDHSGFGLSSFYREGLNASTTAGLNVQASRQATMLGAELGVATSVGNFLLEPATSWVSGDGWSTALGIEYQQFQALADEMLGDRLWNFSLTWRGREFGALDAGQPLNPVALALSGRVGQQITADLSVALGFRNELSRDDDRSDTSTLSVDFRRRIGPGASLDLTLEHERLIDGAIATSAFLSLRIPLGEDSNLFAGWNTDERRRTLRVTHGTGEGLGSVQTDLRLERSDSNQSAFADFDYDTQRFQSSLTLEAGNDRTEGGNRRRASSFDLATGLVWADGHVAITRPVNDSFAMVVAHENLDGALVGVNPTGGGYLAEVDDFGPAVVPTLRSYQYRTILLDVQGLPFGYDIGDESPTVFPTYASGTLVIIGTDAKVVLSGHLVGGDGQPMALRAGELVSLDATDADPIVFFTNRSGTFRVDGVSSGGYAMRLYEFPDLEHRLSVSPEAEGLLDVGTITMGADEW